MVKKAVEVEDYDEDEDEYEDYDDDEEYGKRFGQRRGLSTGKKIMIVFIIILVLLAVFYGAFMLNPNVKDIIIDPPLRLKDENGIEIKCHTVLSGGGSANGDGDIKIKYNGKTEYSGKIKINSDNGRKEILFKDFVIGNGQYEIQMTFNEKTETRYFNLEDVGWAVVEEIEILSADLSTNKEANDITLNVTTAFIPKPAKANLEIKIKYEDNQEKTFSHDVEGISYYEVSDYNYLSTGAGNYTITAKLQNLHIKDTSEFNELELEEPVEKFFNIFPKAVIDGPASARRNTAVSFDASDSWNDGPIWRYEWDFDYKNDDNDENNIPDFTVDATGEEVEHTYTDLGSYDVALRIYGIYLYDIDTDNDGKLDTPFYEAGLAETHSITITLI